MKSFTFNPFGNQSLTVTFDCDVCSNSVTSEEIGIPSPDYTADTANASQNDEEGYAVCNKCEKQFDITIYTTYAGGDGQIEGLSESHNVVVNEIPEPNDEDQ
jgi:transcription elongation factor Elf1